MDDGNARWRGRRVLVIGGTGFLGSTVVARLLASGAEVIGLVRDRAAAGAFSRHRLTGRIHIVHGRTDDLFRIHSALAVHEVQAAFHFPADELVPLDQSIVTLLEAVRKYDTRVPVVLTRSGSASTLVASPVPLGVARFDELFGADPESRGSVARATNAFLASERIAPSDRAHDFVYVNDAAHACLLLAEAVAKHPVPHIREANFRSGWQFGERELFAAIREAVAGRPPLVPFMSEPVNPLGWAPSLNFGEALADTVDWYREQARGSGLRPNRARAA